MIGKVIHPLANVLILRLLINGLTGYLPISWRSLEVNPVRNVGL